MSNKELIKLTTCIINMLLSIRDIWQQVTRIGTSIVRFIYFVLINNCSFTYMHVLLTLQHSFESRSMPTSSFWTGIVFVFDLLMKVLRKPCCIGKIKERFIFQQCLMTFLVAIPFSRGNSELVVKGWFSLTTEL